jgi:hypothetical protein
MKKKHIKGQYSYLDCIVPITVKLIFICKLGLFKTFWVEI